MKEKINSRNRSRYIILGLNIAYYRKKNGLTQAELAEITKLSRTHISNIEAPSMPHSISLEALFKISDALQIEPYKLLIER